MLTDEEFKQLCDKYIAGDIEDINLDNIQVSETKELSEKETCLCFLFTSLNAFALANHLYGQSEEAKDDTDEKVSVKVHTNCVIVDDTQKEIDFNLFGSYGFNNKIFMLIRKGKDYKCSIMEKRNDFKKNKTAYGKGVLGIFPVPDNIERMSGKAADKGRDIVKLYGTHLQKYGFIIKPNGVIKIPGIKTVSDEGIIEFLKVMKTVNNSMHNRYK